MPTLLTSANLYAIIKFIVRPEMKTYEYIFGQTCKMHWHHLKLEGISTVYKVASMPMMIYLKG